VVSEPPRKVDVLQWQVPQEDIMAVVKTATTRAGLTLAGTLALTNQRTPSNGAEGPGPSWGVAVSAGNLQFTLSRVFYDNNAGSWGAYTYQFNDDPTFNYLADPGCAEGEHAYWYAIVDLDGKGWGTWPTGVIVKTSGNGVSVNYTVQIGSHVLTRERTHLPATGRDGSPVYAQETKAADAWADADHPWAWSATLGTISWSGTQTWHEITDEESPDYPGYWQPNLTGITGAGIAFAQSGGVADTDYASASLTVNGTNVSFANRHKTYGVFDLQGADGAVTCHCESTGSVSGVTSWHIAYTLPPMMDFSQVYVRDREGNPVDGIRLDGPFQASPRVPASLNWSTTP